MAELGLHSYDHHTRNERIRSFIIFQKIQENYESLYIDSQSARYNCVKMTKEKAELAKRNFEAIYEILGK